MPRESMHRQLSSLFARSNTSSMPEVSEKSEEAALLEDDYQPILKPPSRMLIIPTLSALLGLIIIVILLRLVVQSRDEMQSLKTNLNSLSNSLVKVDSNTLIDTTVVLNPEGPQQFFPDFGTSNTIFGVVGDYEANVPSTNQAWEGFLEIGGPYLSIAHPREMGLPSSRKVPHDSNDSEFYGVAALHQLHCLAILRDIYVAHTEGRTSHFESTRHPLHCFDYIREGILCAGDTTLEPGLIFFDHAANRSSFTWEGAGVMHQCKNWNQVSNFLSKNRLPGTKDVRML